MRVNIRFNTDYPTKSNYKWRVLYEGKQELVDEIIIKVPCFTTSDFVEGVGLKHHISVDVDGFVIEEKHNSNNEYNPINPEQHSSVEKKRTAILI